MSVFIKANEQLLTNYIYPEIHPHNCVSSTLRLLQFVSPEAADELSKIAIKDSEGSGIITSVIIEILKQVTGYHGIFLTDGPFFSVEPDEQIEFNEFTFTFPDNVEPILKLANFPETKWIPALTSEIQVKAHSQGITPPQYLGNYILSIEVGEKSLPIYNNLFIQISGMDEIKVFFKSLGDLRNKTIRITFIKKMIPFLKSLYIFEGIPKGCLAVGQISLGGGILAGASSHMCVLGRSINDIPYLIDPQSSSIYPEGAFARDIQEIFDYVKKAGVSQINYINSVNKLCKQIDTYSLREEEQPIGTFLNRTRTLFRRNPSSGEVMEMKPIDLEVLQQTIEQLAAENPLKYTDLVEYNRIKKYLETKEC
jgi:hypothetical protein